MCGVIPQAWSGCARPVSGGRDGRRRDQARRTGHHRRLAGVVGLDPYEEYERPRDVTLGVSQAFSDRQLSGAGPVAATGLRWRRE